MSASLECRTVTKIQWNLSCKLSLYFRAQASPNCCTNQPTSNPDNLPCAAQVIPRMCWPAEGDSVRPWWYWILQIDLTCVWYHMGLDFHGSLISWISQITNYLCNYFNENFWHVNYVQERRWTTSRGYAAKSASNSLQRDTFEVGIALLTAVSSSMDDGVAVDSAY